MYGKVRTDIYRGNDPIFSVGDIQSSRYIKISSQFKKQSTNFNSLSDPSTFYHDESAMVSKEKKMN